MKTDMRRSENGGVPVGHHDIVAIGKTVGASVWCDVNERCVVDGVRDRRVRRRNKPAPRPFSPFSSSSSSRKFRGILVDMVGGGVGWGGVG